MKRLTLNTVCTATVYETWEFEVPDDFEPPDNFEYGVGDGTEWIEWLDEDESANTRFVTKVTSEVDDEHERQYRSHTLTAPMLDFTTTERNQS